MVGNLAEIQPGWESMIPELSRPSAGFVKTSALSALIRQDGLGGQLRAIQFIFEFGASGASSQRGGFSDGWGNSAALTDIDSARSDLAPALPDLPMVSIYGMRHPNILRLAGEARPVGPGWAVLRM